MSEIQIITQMTPNPNALKFAINEDVVTDGKITYNSKGECDNQLSKEIFEIEGVKQLLFFENFITVTKVREISWLEVEPKVKTVIYEIMPKHDPNIKQAEGKKEDKKEQQTQMSADFLALNALFDQSIRPALQNDGGDIEIVSLADDVVTVNFQGACQSCPAATVGTLQYIKAIVRDHDPNLTVVMEDSPW